MLSKPIPAIFQACWLKVFLLFLSTSFTSNFLFKSKTIEIDYVVNICLLIKFFTIPHKIRTGSAAFCMAFHITFPQFTTQASHRVLRRFCPQKLVSLSSKIGIKSLCWELLCYMMTKPLNTAFLNYSYISLHVIFYHI